jgi:hypothetical protein
MSDESAPNFEIMIPSSLAGTEIAEGLQTVKKGNYVTTDMTLDRMQDFVARVSKYARRTQTKTMTIPIALVRPEAWHEVVPPGEIEPPREDKPPIEVVQPGEVSRDEIKKTGAVCPCCMGTGKI